MLNFRFIGSEKKKITRIACRRLAITDKSDLALMAWAQEAKIKARDIQTAPINIKGLISVIPEIRKTTVLKPIKGILSTNKEMSCRLWNSFGISSSSEGFIPSGSFLYGREQDCRWTYCKREERR